MSMRAILSAALGRPDWAGFTVHCGPPYDLKYDASKIVDILENRDGPSDEFESGSIRLKLVDRRHTIALDANGNVLNGSKRYRITTQHMKDIQGIITQSLPIDVVYRRYKDDYGSQGG